MPPTRFDAAGSARFLLDSCDVSEPVIPIADMATAWGLKVKRSNVDSFDGKTISVDASREVVNQRFSIAHELGHLVAAHCGLDPTCERTASLIASFTLMPDIAWKRDLANYGWSLSKLCRQYEVSYEAAARRLVSARSAVVSIWDNGALTRRFRSPWLHGRGFSRHCVPRWERGLAEWCREERIHTRDVDGTAAYFVPSPGWERVVVECWEGRSRG